MFEIDYIKTGTWHGIAYLGCPADKVRFVQIEREITEPPSAALIRRTFWNWKVLDVKQRLEIANPDHVYAIKEGENGFLGLYQVTDGREKTKMFNGTTITMAAREGFELDREEITIFVHPIEYSEWIATHSPQYVKAFMSEGFRCPHAGIGISVVMETNDGLTILTRRGLETPVYPGMLYTPGGGPRPGEGSIEALMNEIVEETGLVSGEHYKLRWIKMMAFVSDTHHHGSQASRPELVARLPVNISFSEIEDIQLNTMRERGREADVWCLEPMSLNIHNLRQAIMFHGNQLCPPTEAALAFELLELRKKELRARKGLKAEDNSALWKEFLRFIRTVGGYEREEFVPPIKRLASD